MTTGKTSRRLAQPVLRLEVLREHEIVEAEPRVFCRYRHQTVELGTCAGCVHCDSITQVVHCTVPADGPEPSDDSGEGTEVAVLLEGTLVALDSSMPLGEALAALHGAGRTSLPVVAQVGKIVGVLHDGANGPDIVGAMSSPLSLRAGVSIRQALRLLAGAHAREATVIDDDGKPIGLFRDVDGLRWIGAHRPR